jgi:hypothetical protein
MDRQECLVNDDAVQRLREPGAWVLLGSAALQFLGGLIGLLFNREVPFPFRAFDLVNGDQFFAGVAVVGIVVVAVLLATRWGGGPTPQARNIALAGLVLLGAIAVVEALCVLVGLAAGNGHDGIVLDVSLSTKIAMFLYGVAKLAVLAVGGYYVYAISQASGRAGASTGAFPQPGHALPDQLPYGQAQPAYGQPIAGQPGQRGPEGQQAYLPYRQPPQQTPAGPPHYQPAPQPQAGRTQPSDGEWTVAYGPGGQPAEPGGRSGSVGRGEHVAPKGETAEPSDPYRPPQ